MSNESRRGSQPDRSLHKPVLLAETVKLLDLRPGLVVVDGTLGGGGHSRAIHEQIGDAGTLIGLDRDPRMLGLAASVVNGPNCRLRQANYDNLPEVLNELDIAHVDRILLDLGLSSDQLSDPARGFSFESTGPLDLRYDTTAGLPAWQYIAEQSEAELERVFREFGEERYAARVAEQLVARRRTAPVRTADELAAAVVASIPGRARALSKTHPATRVFQALRIAVNQELDHLKHALNETLFAVLAPAGRAAVITFHSLEDRLVKNEFRRKERWCNLTPKPIVASAVEKRMNPRSRSAKLRAAQKL